MGDFVYADVPIKVDDSVEAYTRLYRRNYASPSYRRLYEQLREWYHQIEMALLIRTVHLAVLTIYDDHEVSKHSC